MFSPKHKQPTNLTAPCCLCLCFLRPLSLALHRAHGTADPWVTCHQQDTTVIPQALLTTVCPEERELPALASREAEEFSFYSNCTLATGKSLLWFPGAFQRYLKQVSWLRLLLDYSKKSPRRALHIPSAAVLTYCSPGACSDFVFEELRTQCTECGWHMNLMC